MTGNRVPGRYNLHRLGWNAFEDLCMQIMRVVLGETCSRFRLGRDEGRDGWFRGQTCKLLLTQSYLKGNFIVQCKHTSNPKSPLSISELKKELANVKKIASKESCHYILMTNRQVSAPSEDAISKAFQGIQGVGKCLVLAETWIEDTIDAHSRLLRLVPRLYGIGDLSQILSNVIEKQTQVLLEELAHSLRTFVPTDSYRQAEHALNERKFVVLVGCPASGKTAIAANLCMVSIAENPETRVLKIEDADQFKETWSPADKHTIYWVDDVFGETTLDGIRLGEWLAALEKIEAAQRHGANIIFCTRDYIFADAKRRMKRQKIDILDDASIIVNVTNISKTERETILYNHIKDGNIERNIKSLLKSHLPALAHSVSFTPEIARRLGNRRFHQGIEYNRKKLQEFFDLPVQHFRDIIQGLSDAETACLAVCLYNNNSVPDPIPDSSLPDAVLSTFDITRKQIREAFEMLEGSFVKRARNATIQIWQVHHPSMIEALQEQLATGTSKLTLYLQSAKLVAVLRDTTTNPPERDSRLVFVPNTAYPDLLARFKNAEAKFLVRIAQYLCERASREFLLAMHATCPEVLDLSLAIPSEPDGSILGPTLAVLLSTIPSDHLFEADRRTIITNALEDTLQTTGWIGFLNIEGIGQLLPELVNNIIKIEIENHFQLLYRLNAWYAQDLSTTDHVDIAMDEISVQTKLLIKLLSSTGQLSVELGEALSCVKEEIDTLLEDKRSEIEEEDDDAANYYDDEYEDHWDADHDEIEFDRFSDVDE